MPDSPRWSNASVVCRLEWRPSRWLIAALLALAALAAAAVLASEMPRPVAWPLAALALLEGLRLARRERRRPPRWFEFAGEDAPVRMLRPGATAATASWDGLALDAAVVQWRGPLAFLSWRDPEGRRRHRCWLPDTLPPPARRALRLAGPTRAGPR